MKISLLTTLVAATLVATVASAEDIEAGFVKIFDGTTFTGWKTANENTNTWRIEEDALVTRGGRCHLYYVGADKPFKDFELKVDVMTEPGSNGGIYFHTQYQSADWPRQGFESQVNNSHSDWIRTGSLYGIVNTGLPSARDNQWWTQTITVKGSRITVKVDGNTVLEYNEPAGAQAGRDFTRKLAEGTFALQAHDPKSVVRYKNIRVKRLN